MSSYLYIVSALAVWSSWGLVVRGLDMPVHVIAFYNSLFALVFQGAGILFIKRRKGFRLSGGLGALVLLAVCGLVNLLLFLYALRATTVAGALLTHYTAPVFVALFAPFFLGDRAGRWTVYALFISVAGLVMIFASGLGGRGAGELMGLAAGAASGLAYAFVIIISRGISASHHPLKVVFVQAVVGAAVLGAWVVPEGSLHITPQGALVCAVLGLAHSTLAVMVYLYGIRGVTAQEAGILGYLEPVLGILLAFVFLGEAPGALSVAGGLMVVAAGSMVVVYGAPQYAGGLDDNRG